MDSLSFYILASLSLILTPGPDMIYVLARGIANGPFAGVTSAIGVAAGILVHTMAAAMGLAILLRTSALAFWSLKIIGGIYLIFLGFQMIQNRDLVGVNRPQDKQDLPKCFLQGFYTNVLNPKVALFFIAFLPQFVGSGVQSGGLYMLFLGSIYASMTAVLYIALGATAGRTGNWLKNKKTAGAIRIGSASVLMLLGIRLLLPVKT